MIAARIGALAETMVLPAPGPISEGEARFVIEQFALTANNVTYAVHGDDFGYWRFFPAPEGHGVVPVWGFGRVIESRADGIEIGSRWFGYWPMGREVVLMPVQRSAHGFTDGVAHRATLPPFYNRYVPASAAWGEEAVQCLFRPLYATSFLLDCMLATRPLDTLVLSSASSKTALGLAQAAGNRGQGRQAVVGLTSAANREFCLGTGYYDHVFSYDDIGGVPGEAIGFVDFAGNGDVRRAVHTLLADRLAESHVVGDTHWQQPNSNDLPGPVPKMFFAPSVGQERVAAWGAAGYDSRLNAAWAGFAPTLGWLRIETVAGSDAVAAAWAGLVHGRIDPAAGIIACV